MGANDYGGRETSREESFEPGEPRTTRRDEDTVRDERAAPYTRQMTADELAGESIDRVRWGPIIAGLVAAVASLVLLNLIGLAVGLSALDPNNLDVQDVSTAAGIWSAVAALLAFFIGGWVAGHTVAPSTSAAGRFPGIINGAIVWATTVALLMPLAAFGAAGAAGILGAAFVTDGAPTGDELSMAAQSAWGTVIALVLTLGAAVLGGWVGRATEPLNRPDRR